MLPPGRPIPHRAPGEKNKNKNRGNLKKTQIVCPRSWGRGERRERRKRKEFCLWGPRKEESQPPPCSSITFWPVRDGEDEGRGGARRSGPTGCGFYLPCTESSSWVLLPQRGQACSSSPPSKPPTGELGGQGGKNSTREGELFSLGGPPCAPEPRERDRALPSQHGTQDRWEKPPLNTENFPRAEEGEMNFMYTYGCKIYTHI